MTIKDLINNIGEYELNNIPKTISIKCNNFIDNIFLITKKLFWIIISIIFFIFPILILVWKPKNINVSNTLNKLFKNKLLYSIIVIYNVVLIIYLTIALLLYLITLFI